MQDQRNSPNGSDNLTALRDILDAFNRHDLDTIVTYFAEDAVLETPRGPDPWGTRYEGIQAIRRGLAGRFEGIPDVQYRDDAHWVSGDHGLSSWLLTGTATTGERIEVRGCDLWTFRNGKVVRKDSYWKLVDR